MTQSSLLVFAVRRVFWAIPLLLLVMLLTFALMRGAGGSPFRLESGGVPPALQARLEEFYGLDEPWFVEFATYVRNVVTLRFGPSLVDRYGSVDVVIEQSFPVTGELVLLAALWAIPLGMGLGLLGGLRRGTVVDAGATIVATALLAVPVFLFADLFATYLVSRWHVVPFGWEDWRTKATASFVLALAPAGYIARLVRAAVAETVQQDFVRTARAKGLDARRVALVHVLGNSLVPFLHGAVPTLALLVTGTFFVERQFGIPGAGVDFVQATKLRDYPMVMGLTVSLAAIVIAVNLIADVVSAALDPRIHERRT